MAKAPTKPTRAIAMAAKCHDCSGEYIDGKYDCSVPDCPLYPWMPYRDKSIPPQTKWLHYNPRRVGRVLWEESGREMSEEEKQAAADRLQKSREARQESEGPVRKLKRRV